MISTVAELTTILDDSSVDVEPFVLSSAQIEPLFFSPLAASSLSGNLLDLGGIREPSDLRFRHARSVFFSESLSLGCIAHALSGFIAESISRSPAFATCADVEERVPFTSALCDPVDFSLVKFFSAVDLFKNNSSDVGWSYQSHPVIESACMASTRTASVVGRSVPHGPSCLSDVVESGTVINRQPVDVVAFVHHEDKYIPDSGGGGDTA